MSTPMELHSQRIDQVLGRAPIVPVLSINRVEDAVPLARALVAGGLPVLEVTLRTEAAIGAIRAIREEVPDAIEVKAGINCSGFAARRGNINVPGDIPDGA